MTVQVDPVDPAWVDESESAQHSLPLPESVSGFGDGQNLLHTKLNTIARSAAAWKVWLDQGRLPIENALTGGSCLLSAAGFEYTTLGGLSETIVADVALIVLGRHVSITQARLEAAGLSALITYGFTATKDHHFYISADGAIEVDVVAVATPASPGPGQELLHTVTTNATDIILQTPGPLFAARQVRIEAPWCFEDVLRIEDAGATYARLDFGTASADEGWYIETQANGSLLRIWEKNSTDVEVVNFGDVSNPVTFSRDVLMSFALGVSDTATFAADVSMGDGKTSSATWSGWLRTRTQTAGNATRDSWGEFTGTSTAKDVTPSQTYVLASAALPDGSYAGYVRVAAVRANGPNSTMAHLEYNVTFTVSSGTAAIITSAGVYAYDAIGFSGWALGASGGAPTFDITIPALGFNVNLSATWTAVRVTQS